ncbi:MAG: recombinase family protein [Phycisphaerales bacterium]
MAKKPDTPNVIRCAIYTRKSTEEGLDQAFNSLHAQRESAESYIDSQKSKDWVCLPDEYDDGGFSGGNVERPGLKRLMADIEAGKIDCVVVYKVDRLSRSLMDFSRLMETFDKKGVSFVSVTQHLNTTHSMGRLTLNILLSFAQFEREIISERTRDKIAGARRRGKWAGGRPVLGYNLVSQPGGSVLLVNADEAKQVREIYEWYLNNDGGLMSVVAECARRGWTTKQWTTKAGKPMGGRALDKGCVYALLTNVVYSGRVRHHADVYEGEHEAIVARDMFDRVQAKLKLNGRTGGAKTRGDHQSLLKGLVRCGACDCTMGHHFATKSSGKTSGKSTKRYRYYVCLKAQKLGRDTCPAPSIPAGELEKFVVGTVRDALAGDRVIHAVAERAMGILAKERPDLVVDPDEVIGAIESFDPVWDAMTPKERSTLVRGLVERVTYDAALESIGVTFREDAVTPQPGAAVA